MRRILKTRSRGGHYEASAFILRCFDDRFRGAMRAFEDHFGKYVDVVVIAGGAQSLASGSAAERKFVLDQIAASVKLHKTKQVALEVHIDCGKYGGSKSFAGHRAEAEHHKKELTKAARVVKKRFPKLKVRCYLADFDGVDEI